MIIDFMQPTITGMLFILCRHKNSFERLSYLKARNGDTDRLKFFYT